MKAELQERVQRSRDRLSASVADAARRRGESLSLAGAVKRALVVASVGAGTTPH